MDNLSGSVFILGNEGELKLSKCQQKSIVVNVHPSLMLGIIIGQQIRGFTAIRHLFQL